MKRPWSEHLEYPKIPVYEMLRETAQKFPDNVATEFMGKVFTYKELDELTDKFATALVDLGVKKGDRVAIFMLNVPQFVIAYYGILKVGAAVVLCNPLYKEHELEFQLNDSDCNTIVILNLPDPSLYTIFKNIQTKTSVKNVIVTDIGSALPTIKRILGSLLGKVPKGPALESGDHDFFTLLKATEPNPPQIKINPKEDVAALQYTGGTTGIPKGAVLTHYNLISNCLQVEEISGGLQGEERFLCALPLYHSYGMTTVMNTSILLGAENTLIINPRDIPNILKTIAKRKPTFFNGVPAMYGAIANHPDASKYDLTSIKACISGAAPLPDAVCKAFEQVTGATLVEGYGLSEASPVTHSNPIDADTKKIEPLDFHFQIPNVALLMSKREKKICLKENRENYS